MCIISGPVVSVGSTKILCLPSKNRKRQLTVYRNAVNTPHTNAMCLPVPNPFSVKFEKVPKDIFSQCKNSFIFGKSFSYGALGNTKTFLKSKSYLAVQSHGSYDVVVVPSMLELERIPPSFTVLTDEVKEFLRTSYPDNFGIVLCRLKAGSTDYEPFAYSHDLHANTQLFVPTKHFHNMNSTNEKTIHDKHGWKHGWEAVFMSPMERNMPSLVSTRFVDDWDHEIYSTGTPTWCHDSSTKQLDTTNTIKWDNMPADFQLDSTVVLRCKEIVGHGQNLDVEMPLVF